MSDRDYFNQLASEWDNICFHDPNKVSYIVKQLKPRPSSTVLDVGTGTGVLIPYKNLPSPSSKVGDELLCFS